MKRGPKNGKMNTRGMLWLIDLAALIVLGVLAVCYLYLIRHSVNLPDEAGYLNYPHRFFLGDSPVIDEWSLAQFFSLLLLLPFYAYYGEAQATEGIILYFRGIYAVSQILVLAFIYFSLRRYGERKCAGKRDRALFALGALIAMIVFSCYIPWGIASTSYYTMSLMGIVVFCLTLLCYPAGYFRNFFAGAVLAAVIIAEPASVAIYFAVIAAIIIIRFINKKKQKDYAPYLFQKRFPLFFNLGVFTLAVPALSYIVRKCGITEFCQNIPRLFQDSSQNAAIANREPFRINLYREAIQLYGGYLLLGMLLLTVIAALLRKQRNRYKLFVLLGLAAFVIAAYCHAWAYEKEFGVFQYREMLRYHGAPFYLTGPALMLLAEKPDKKICAGWCICAFASLLFSQSSNSCVCWGGTAAAVFSVMLAVQLILESSEDAATQSNKVKWAPILSVCLAAAYLLTGLLNETGWLILQTRFHLVESAMVEYTVRDELDCEITKGPYKGIYTTSGISAIYSKMMGDLDTIRGMSREGDCVFVCFLSSWCYLYLNTGYSYYATGYEYNETFLPELKEYWAEHPAKIPTIIYIPFYDNESFYRIRRDELNQMRTGLKECFLYESIDGRAGEILRVTGYLPQLPE